jgi:hypothetical protein
MCALTVRLDPDLRNSFYYCGNLFNTLDPPSPQAAPGKTLLDIMEQREWNSHWNRVLKIHSINRPGDFIYILYVLAISYRDGHSLGAWMSIQYCGLVEVYGSSILPDTMKMVIPTQVKETDYIVEY